MKKSLMKGIIISGAVITGIMLSAVSLQAIMFPIAVNNCGDSSSTTTITKTVMFPIAVPTENAAIGDAVAADVRLGKTFSSTAAGTGVTGTAEFSGSCTSALAPVRATGQKGCYNGESWVSPCVNPIPTGQDGNLQSGVAWPEQRFTDNTDGTVTDELTGLIWLKQADCISPGEVSEQGNTSWSVAMANVTGLNSDECGLTDGSAAGDWRLPTADELISLLDREHYNPALPDGNPFSSLPGGVGGKFWTTTAYVGVDASNPALLGKYRWVVDMAFGTLAGESQNNSNYVWPVRGPN